MNLRKHPFFCLIYKVIRIMKSCSIFTKSLQSSCVIILISVLYKRKTLPTGFHSKKGFFEAVSLDHEFNHNALTLTQVPSGPGVLFK